MFNPLKYLRNRKVGLALGSGGAKGLSHISVIEYLESMDIPISMIAGSSIGAVIGGVYACGTMEAFKREMKSMTTSKRFSLLDPVFPKSGLIGGAKFMRYMKKFIPKDTRIEDLTIPLAVAATDMITGKAVVFKSGNLLEALRASVSIPGIVNPVRYKNTFLIDGGVANPLPVNILKTMGAGITVAVNLHPRPGEEKLKDYVHENIEKFIILEDAKNIKTVPPEKKRENADENRSFFNLLLPGKDKAAKKSDEADFPSIFEVMFESIQIMEYVNTRLMLRYNSPAVLIEPYIPYIGTLDFEEASEILAEGYKAASKARNKLIRKVKIWI